MTEDEAMQALSHLVGGLSGFGDASVDEFCAQLQKLDHPDVLEAVCEDLVRTWANRWRPNVPDVLARYHDHPVIRAEREARAAAPPEPAERIPTFAEGIEIARQGYHQECYLRGKTPEVDLFEVWADLAQRAERDERRRHHSAR